MYTAKIKVAIVLVHSEKAKPGKMPGSQCLINDYTLDSAAPVTPTMIAAP